MNNSEEQALLEMATKAREATIALINYTYLQIGIHVQQMDYPYVVKKGGLVFDKELVDKAYENEWRSAITASAILRIVNNISPNEIKTEFTQIVDHLSAHFLPESFYTAMTVPIDDRLN